MELRFMQNLQINIVKETSNKNNLIDQDLDTILMSHQIIIKII